MPLYSSSGKYYWQDSPGSIANEVDAKDDVPGTNPVTGAKYYDARGAVALPSGVTTAPRGSVVNSGQRYTSAPGGGSIKTPLEEAEANFYAGLPRTPLTPEDEANIRKQTESQFKARVDATNAYYDQLVSQERAGPAQDRLGQQRSLAARSGILGNDFGNAQKDKVVTANKEIEGSSNARRNLELESIFNKIDSTAYEMIEKRKTEALTNAKSYLDYLKNTQTDSRENVVNLAKLGVSIDELSQEDYRKILDQTGYSDVQLRLTWNANLPKAKQIDYDYKTIPGKAIYTDPLTGKPAVIDLGVQVPEGWKLEALGNGQLVMFNEKGESKIIGEEGQYRDSSKDELTAAQIEQARAGAAKSRAEVEKLGKEGDEESAGSKYKTESGKRVIDAVDSLSKIANDNPGIFGRTAAIPIPRALRSDAYRSFEAQLDTLKSNIAFGALTEMREAAKTGGALGQVSDTENRLLSATLGALNMSQSPEDIKKQLTKIRESVKRWNDALAQYGGGTADDETSALDFSSMSDEELNAFIEENGGQ